MKKLYFIAASLILSSVLLLFMAGCDPTNNDDPTPSVQVGDTLWIHTKPNLENTTFISNIPLAIGTDGTIYYEADGGTLTWESSRVYAINKEDGSLKWMTEPMAIWHPNSNILVADDGTVYILSYTSLYSIDPATGAFNWVWEVPNTLPYDGNDVYTYGEVGGLALLNNGDLILKTNGSGVYYRAMYCINTQGTINWYRFIGASSMNISVGSTGTIFDYEYDQGINYLYAVNPADGTVLWRKQMNYSGHAANNIAITNNGDLVCNMSDSMALVNPANGSYIWKVVMATSEKSKIINVNGQIYIYDQWSGLHMVDGQNGSDLEVLNIGYGCILDNAGNFYRVAGEKVMCYSVQGEALWEFVTGGANSNSMALSNNNILYVASSTGVFAIQTDSPIGQSGWPCPGHDNRNTYNYSKH